MTKRLLAAVAVLILVAMALHGAAHAARLETDVCPSCVAGAVRAEASESPAVVRVENVAFAVATPAVPVERAAVVFVPFARPPPRG